MSLAREMKALNSFIDIERSDDQMRSERLLNQTEKLMRSDFLSYGNSLLRASLILLTIAMIFFTVMKICKLFYQIRNHQRQQQVSESDNETPHILVETHSADYQFFGNKKWNKNGKFGRTFHLWKTKSDSDSNSLPSKDMKVNTSLSNKWDSKRDNSQNIYPISKSSLKSLTKGAEMTSSDTIKTTTYSGGIALKLEMFNQIIVTVNKTRMQLFFPVGGEIN